MNSLQSLGTIKGQTFSGSPSAKVESALNIDILRVIRDFLPLQDIRKIPVTNHVWKTVAGKEVLETENHLSVKQFVKRLVDLIDPTYDTVKNELKKISESETFSSFSALKSLIIQELMKLDFIELTRLENVLNQELPLLVRDVFFLVFVEHELTQMLSHNKNLLLLRYCKKLVRVGRFEEAEKIFQKKISEPFTRECCGEYAITLAEAGLFNKAKEMARQSTCDNSRNHALYQISLKLTEKGYLEEAIELSKEITDGRRAEALIEAMKVYTQPLGKDIFELIKNQADQMEYELNKNRVLKHVAIKMVEVGFFFEADKIVLEISPGTKEETLQGITLKLIEQGCFDRAWQVFSQINDTGLEQVALKRFAIKMVECNLSFDEVISKISPENLDEVLQGIALKLVEQRRFGEAWKLILKMRNYRLQEPVLEEMAVKMAELGLYDKAHRVAFEITCDWKRNLVLKAIYSKIIEQVPFEQAIKIINKFTHDNPSKKDIAIILAKNGHFQEAKELAYQIENKQWTVAFNEAMEEIAVALAQANYFEEAEKCAREISYFPCKMTALESIAVELGRAGFFKKARSIASEMNCDERKNKTLTQVAISLIKSDLFHEAKEVILSMPDKDNSKLPLFNTLDGIGLQLIDHFT